MANRLLQSRQFSCSELQDGSTAVVRAKQETMNDDELEENIKVGAGVDVSIYIYTDSSPDLDAACFQALKDQLQSLRRRRAEAAGF